MDLEDLLREARSTVLCFAAEIAKDPSTLLRNHDHVIAAGALLACAERLPAYDRAGYAINALQGAVRALEHGSMSATAHNGARHAAIAWRMIVDAL